MADQEKNQRSFRRKLVGTVRSAAMNKTVVVEVVRRDLDSKYHKYVKDRRRYKAHDENNELVRGDRVEIQENRPISKTKRWVVTRLLAKSPERLLAGGDGKESAPENEAG